MLSALKKMKKSVAPLSLKGTVQGVRKCILPGFLRLFVNLKWGVTEKNFLVFSRKIYYKLPNLCNRAKTRLLNIPLKTASFQRFYVTFLFFTSSTKNRSLIRATVLALFDCVLTLMVNNGC